jgi:hypothetical protein
MYVEFIKPTLVGDRNLDEGDHSEVPDDLGHRYVLSGAAKPSAAPQHRALTPIEQAVSDRGRVVERAEAIPSKSPRKGGN